MAPGNEYLANPDFAEFDPRTLVPRHWEFRPLDPSAPLRERWLSHYRIGAEERAGLAVLAPGAPSGDGILPEALGQWVTLHPYEAQPVLRIGLGLVGASDSHFSGDFRVLVESESGNLRELFWGRLDNRLWRDLALPLTPHAGQTLRVIVENVSENVLLVDYVRAGAAEAGGSRWRSGRLEVEVVRADPYLTECDAVLNEIAAQGDGQNPLLLLEAGSWAASLAAGAPYAYGELVPTSGPRYAKCRQALHLVTQTQHQPMRRSILHRAFDAALRTVRRDRIGSLVTPPLLVGAEDLEEAETFARDLILQFLEWYQTYQPRQFTRFTVATLFHPIEIHDLYHRVFDETFREAAAGAQPPGSQEIIRLAGMANLVKTWLGAGTSASESEAELLEHVEDLLDALHGTGGAAHATLERVLLEAGLSERQMLDILTASYRDKGRLDDRATKTYERLHELDPANIENTRAMASAYRCRFRLDGERTRAVYEQVFRADAGDDENNRFLAAQYILAGPRESTAMRGLVLDRVGLGSPAPGTASRRPGEPEADSRAPRCLPAAVAFLHPADRPASSETYGDPRPDAGAPPPSAAGTDVAQPSEPKEPPEPSTPIIDVAPPPAEPADTAGAAAPAFAASPAETSAEPAAPSPSPFPFSFSELARRPEPPPPPAADPDQLDTESLLKRLAAEVSEARKAAGDD
ncbi:MAG: hypothetical protein HY303_01830 [Candidatus Wallbacteria bacterium]|nr:hypothetical protein [Candidatus Wallbacteria bacterium]